MNHNMKPTKLRPSQGGKMWSTPTPGLTPVCPPPMKNTRTAPLSQKKTYYSYGEVVRDFVRKELQEHVPVILTSSGDVMIRCPTCRDARSSCAVNTNTARYLCFLCGDSGDWNKLVAALGFKSRFSLVNLT